MFTGLVEEIGKCQSLQSIDGGTRLTVAAHLIPPDATLGESIAVNGCCLTVVHHDHQTVAFDLLEATLSRTNLGRLRPGGAVNLERALQADARLGGHFVQGHIDGSAVLLERWEKQADLGLRFALPAAFARYVIAQGSVAVNGVSLTVAELEETAFTVWIIPHTRSHTNLSELIPGATVNLEFDLLAKYTERLLASRT